jgi:hypothetical protein
VAFAAALVFGPIACIALVDDPAKIGTTCGIEAASGTCGSCLRARCQPQLDACCGDETCRPVLDEVDACTTKASADACSNVRKGGDQATAAGRLRRCIDVSCGASCDSNPLKTACTISRFDGGCSCTLDAPPNGTHCSEFENRLRVCCAEAGWPASGRKCSCFTWGCRKTGAGCECAEDRNEGEPTCTGKHCCATGSRCKCSDAPCQAGEREVGTCNAGCGGRRVDVCHVHESATSRDSGG